jgi:hypothetical protein
MVVMVTVDSRRKWNDTGTDLIQGKQYRYRATGSWQDWYIVCDANGYSRWMLWLFGWMRRVPVAHWFQLIGVVDKAMSHPIRMGTEGTFTAPASGRLWVFANDAAFAYGNNTGTIELQVCSD